MIWLNLGILNWLVQTLARLKGLLGTLWGIVSKGVDELVIVA